MIIWLLVIILAYLFFSLASFGDKLILAGPPKPKLYTFYVGLLGILVVFLIPFADFGLPSLQSIIWIVLEASVYLLGLYFLYHALEKFDVSRVIPTIGAIQPILILILTWIFFGLQKMVPLHFLAFILLFLGSIIISSEKKPQLTFDFLKLATFSSFLFSLDYIFTKLVFLHEPFLQGFIWMRLCTVVIVLVFLLHKKFRKEMFAKKSISNIKTDIIFLFTQLAGSLGYILQSLAIALVPIAYLVIVNSLRGIQYVFLFIITLFFSIFLPKILKEKISKKITQLINIFLNKNIHSLSI